MHFKLGFLNFLKAFPLLLNIIVWRLWCRESLSKGETGSFKIKRECILCKSIHLDKSVFFHKGLYDFSTIVSEFFTLYSLHLFMKNFFIVRIVRV